MENKVIKKRGYVEIICPYKGKEYVVSVDNEDIHKLDGISGNVRVSSIKGRMYAHIRYKGEHKHLHRYLTDAKKGEIITFLDRNGLNLRKANLVSADMAFVNRHRGLQCNNESGHPGVTWSSRDDKWVARIFKDGKCVYLGSYRDKTEAIKARRKAERQYYPED